MNALPSIILDREWAANGSNVPRGSRVVQPDHWASREEVTVGQIDCMERKLGVVTAA